jgi:hypothetical protein
MTTEFSTAQLATILSALAGKQRKPTTKAAAMRAIHRQAEEIGQTAEAVLAFAPGLLEGRQDPATWREQLAAMAGHNKAGETEGSAATGGSAERLTLRPGTKQALVAGLLAREQGATLDELIAATGWLPHTARAALTGLRRKGGTLEKSTREDGKTAYRLASPGAAVAESRAAVSGV